MARIELSQVSKRYANGFLALHPTSLVIEPGEFVTIMGPSGAGKSTLIRTINGLEPVSAGKVQVGGQPLTARSARAIRARVGMVFQQFNLVERLSVMTNVLTGRLAYRTWVGSVFYLFRREDLDIAHEALARVGLTAKAWERADKLSGGQQQRVGIARALAQRPHVILADEPVASLDPVTAEEIMVLLKEINRSDGITVVVNLHQVDFIQRYADRVIGMNAGRVVFDGSPNKLDNETLAAIYQRDPIQSPTWEAPRGLALANT
jgi:phosphonate transport system ATP-binding protein